MPTDARSRKNKTSGSAHAAVEGSFVCHLDFALIDDIKVVAFVVLLDDDLSRMGADREHGVKDVGPLVFIQM